MRGEKGVWYLGLGVAEREPKVRPWKEELKEMNSCFGEGSEGDAGGDRSRPTLRQNFIAASFASEPEFEMKARAAVCIPPDASVLSTRSRQIAPVQGL